MSDTPRAQPFFCPFCGEQDLRPGAEAGWHCRTCDRRFELRFLGLGEVAPGSSSGAVAAVRGSAARSGDRRQR
jgi:hypothetical protein